MTGGNTNFQTYEQKRGQVGNDAALGTTAMFRVGDFYAMLPRGAAFVFARKGDARVRRDDGSYSTVPQGFFAVFPDASVIQGAHVGADVMVVVRLGADAPFLMGGPVEPNGRLKYIDGCMDTLLLSPWRRGEACLNALYLPPGTDQTMHTHPSTRVGMVVSGSGVCATPVGDVALEPGVMWQIVADKEHRFVTTGDELRIVAYHPDSDFGPDDETHPMLNRTVVDGVPVTDESLRAIRTT